MNTKLARHQLYCALTATTIFSIAACNSSNSARVTTQTSTSASTTPTIAAGTTVSTSTSTAGATTAGTSQADVTAVQTAVDGQAASINSLTTALNNQANLSTALAVSSSTPDSSATDGAGTGSFTISSFRTQALPSPVTSAYGYVLIPPDSSKNAGYITAQVRIDTNKANPSVGDTDLDTWYNLKNITDTTNGTGYVFRHLAFNEVGDTLWDGRHGKRVAFASYPPADMFPSGVSMPTIPGTSTQLTALPPSDPTNLSSTPITLPAKPILREDPVTIVVASKGRDSSGNPTVSGTATVVIVGDSATNLLTLWQRFQVLTDKTVSTNVLTDLRGENYYNYVNKQPTTNYEWISNAGGLYRMVWNYNYTSNTSTGTGSWISADGSTTLTVSIVLKADSSETRTITDSASGRTTTLNFKSNHSGTGTSTDKNGNTLATMVWDKTGKGTITPASTSITIPIPKTLPNTIIHTDKASGRTTTLTYKADGSGTGTMLDSKGNQVATLTWDTKGNGTFQPATRPYQV